MNLREMGKCCFVFNWGNDLGLSIYSIVVLRLMRNWIFVGKCLSNDVKNFILIVDEKKIYDFVCSIVELQCFYDKCYDRY